MPGKQDQTIVCFGDSNTHGYNAVDMGRFTREERWPCLLEGFLGEGFTVAEEGLSGRTACFDDPLFEGLCGLTYLHPCLMTHEPVDLLVIMLGTNDVKERFSATPANIAKGMERLVQKALDTPLAFRGNKPNILLIAPPPIEEGYLTTEIAAEMGQSCVEKSRALAPYYKELSGRLGIHYLDAGKIPGVGMNPCDYMHLSREAHRKLAEKLSEAIPGFLK